jgi:tripartite-type tricarboxylate transporter receptor subunit TctC
MSTFDRRRFIACSLATALAPWEARAQGPWPSKPFRLIVPGGPGGVTDIRARWIASRLSPILGQPVIVENKPGAGGILGMEAAARAEPDGYTMAIVHQGTMAVNPFIYPKLSYDPLRDFIPLTPLGIGSLALVVRPDLEARNVAELVSLARARTAPLAFGSPGLGTPPHLAAELFVREAGIKALHVPYRGGGQAAADLMAGHIDFAVEGLTVTRPLVQSGRLRALATTGLARVASMPDLPTLREAGLPGYLFVGWVGIAVPANVPRPVVAAAHEALAKVLSSQEAIDWFAAVGAETGLQSPEAFASFVREEQARLGRLVREAGIRME